MQQFYNNKAHNNLKDDILNKSFSCVVESLKKRRGNCLRIPSAGFRLPLLPLDLVEPAAPGEDRGRNLVCWRHHLQCHDDARISDKARDDRFQ